MVLVEERKELEFLLLVDFVVFLGTRCFANAWHSFFQAKCYFEIMLINIQAEY